MLKLVSVLLILSISLSSASAWAQAWRPQVKPGTAKSDGGRAFRNHREMERLYALGMAYKEGTYGYPKNFKLAMSYLLHAAFIGHEASAYFLGQMYMEINDITRAVYWLTEAKRNGVYQAQVLLLKHFPNVPYTSIIDEISGDKYDSNLAKEDLPKVSENLLIREVKKVNKRAQKKAHKKAQREKKIRKKEQLKKKKKEEKWVVKNGWRIRTQKESKKSKTPEKKREEVFTLFTGEEFYTEFKNTDPRAYGHEFHQALSYKANGDYSASFKIFKKYAQQGDGEAQFNLAQFYRLGWGIERDITKASYWYGRAALQGNSEAQLNYSLALYEQKGKVKVKKRVMNHLIHYWAHESASQGNIKAKEFLNIINNKEK